MTTVTRGGIPYQTNGELPEVGSAAPDFRLVKGDLSDVTLAQFAGQRKVLSILPSLDTPTCAKSTRRFNELVSRMDNTVLLVISADLPYAQKRFCETEGLENVIPLSLMRTRKFAKDYGVLLLEGPLEGITACAIVMIDGNDQVVYTEMVPEIRQEPDYEAVLKLLGKE